MNLYTIYLLLCYTIDMSMIRTWWCIAVLLFFVVMFRKAHKRTLAKEYDLYSKDLTKGE